MKFAVASALCLAVEGARVRRTRVAKQDCFSKYDGMTLLHLTPCTSGEVSDMTSQLGRLDCTLVSDELEVKQGVCADAEVVCSSEGAASLGKLKSASMISSDAGAHWRQSSGVAQPFATGGLSVASTFYSAWRDFDARMARVESVVQASGGIATMETAGKTLQGRDMKIVRFTGPGYTSGDKKLFLTFNLHAREWIAGMSGVYAVEQLVAKVRQDANYLAGMEVVMMPMANPDGFLHSSNNDRMHRKNMRVVSSGCFGVDVNRNFNASWASGGSSNRVCDDTYHGPQAMSEPETNVIQKLLEETPLSVYIDIHAYSKYILEAYGYTKATNPRRAEYSALGKSIQSAIKSRYGNEFKEGPIAQVLYEASGSSVDAADNLGALGLCFELRPGQNGGGGFAPPASEILPAAEECFDGILASIDYVANPPAPTPAPAPTPLPSICETGCNSWWTCRRDSCKQCPACQ